MTILTVEPSGRIVCQYWNESTKKFDTVAFPATSLESNQPIDGGTF